MRLNKFIAQAGITSRRKADQLIEQGKVKVNKRPVFKPYYQVDPNQDIITIGSKVIKPRDKDIYLLLNKPIEVITALSDPQGRTTIYDLLPASLTCKRPVPVGRLDYFSEGLLLLTTDGELCYKLTHPKFKIPKTYRVKIRTERELPSKLKIMEKGMVLKEGEKVWPAQTRIITTNKHYTLIDITIKQGLNRQIRRMCRDLDLTILQLKRIKLGPLGLKNLAPGKFRHLSSYELNLLKRTLKQSR